MSKVIKKIIQNKATITLLIQTCHVIYQCWKHFLSSYAFFTASWKQELVYGNIYCNKMFLISFTLEQG